jgi:hypothetical protein
MEVSSTTKQVTVERVVVATLEAAALRVNLQQPVDGLGLEHPVRIVYQRADNRKPAGLYDANRS